MAAERVGIFGGTFDPVHVGHLVAAVNARHQLSLDRVLLVVNNLPWQKVGARQITSSEDRFAMVASAVENVQGLEASRIEMDRGGMSYTADTVEELHALHPDSELFLIIGADAAAELDTWERVELLQDLVTLVVVNRAGRPPVHPGEPWRAETLLVPSLEISSTDLRQRAAEGRPLDYLVPSGAIRCIRDRDLYPGSR